MYCLFLFCAILYISLPHNFLCQAEVYDIPFERIIQDYFKSESVRRFRKEWDTIRKPLEHALVTSIKDTVGSPRINVYIKKIKDKLAAGFFHNDNQVRVILKDLNLEAMPFCIFPDVKFALGSNVLKVHTTLSKMIIHADYALIRNKTDIIHDPKEQDPFKSSPFLFEQVHDVGKVAIALENCELKGFIIALMNGESINLGHDRFNIRNCAYTIEIYRPGEDSPPVIARYNMTETRHGLGLTDLLKKPYLANELLPKLQAAIFSFINTSAIFGDALNEYRENQEIVFLLTATQLAEVVRQMNKLTVHKNQGAIEMADYEVHWDDGRVKPSSKNKTGSGESLKLTDLVLSGLDTLYSAHAGGPFEFDTVRIAEKLRYSSLQVRGKLEIKSTWSDMFDFAAEISDMTVELHMELSDSKDISKPDKLPIKDRKLEVEGLRRMTFTVPTIIFGSAESMIGGYLLKEVPKLITSHTTAMFDQAMQQRGKPEQIPDPDAIDKSDESVVDLSKRNEKDSDLSSDEENFSRSVNADFGEFAVEEPTSLDDMFSRNIQGVRERDTFKKNKKRFKSPNSPRRRRLSRHVVSNVIKN